jgi:hypothetical protein
MATTRLQDDLLHQFREEKRMIQSQLEDFEPLAVSLRKPAAQRLVRKGLIVLGEILCWALFLGAIAACVFLQKLLPFRLLFQLKQPEHAAGFDSQNVSLLRWSVYGLISLCGVTFLLLARALGSIRQKNDILSMAGSRIKVLVGQHLQRKASIDAIEQRHFNELPAHNTRDVNAIPNPGYDAAEGIVQKPI